MVKKLMTDENVNLSKDNVFNMKIGKKRKNNTIQGLCTTVASERERKKIIIKH